MRAPAPRRRNAISAGPPAAQKVRLSYAQGGNDPRQIRSAKALQEALLRLLERKAFDQITVREITAEAGVHNATFFRHHADKESLLDTIAADEINRLVAFSLPGGLTLEGNMALCEYVGTHRALWRALLNGGARSAMREEYVRLSMQVASAHTGAKSWLPEELAVVCSTMLIIETLSWWLGQDEGVYSCERIAGMLFRLITDISEQSALQRL